MVPYKTSLRVENVSLNGGLTLHVIYIYMRVGMRRWVAKDRRRNNNSSGVTDRRRPSETLRA